MRSVLLWGVGLLAGVGQAGFCSTPALAEGGGRESCCPQLEVSLSEFVGVLSGTGRSERSVRVYGQLNRALMYWDDGAKSDVYAIDNETSSSRLGIVGTHRFVGGLKAGYRVEIDSALTLSSEVSSGDPVGDLGEGAVRLRHANWYVEDKGLGRLTFGQQSPATDDVTLINLGSKMNDAALHYNNNFGIWLNTGGRIITDLKWGQIAHNVDSMRGLFVRFDTPLTGGFVVSAAGGEDGVWDVAVRYRTNGGPFRFAAGFGFMVDSERNFEDAKGSASLIHEATGLYASAAGGVRDDDVSPLSVNGLAHFQYLQLGISAPWLPYGKTTFYGDVGLYRNFNVGHLLQADLVHRGQMLIWGTLAETEVRRWGIGAEQSFDEKSLLVYAQAHHYEARISGFPCDTIPAPSPDKCGGDLTKSAPLPTKPWAGFIAGVRLQF